MNEDVIDIGDEVLCIDASIKPERMEAVIKKFPIWIKEQKYIVRDVMHNDDIVVGLLLEGVKNPLIFIPLLKRYQEPAFADWRFVKQRTAYQIREESGIEEGDLDLVIEELEEDGRKTEFPHRIEQ